MRSLQDEIYQAQKELHCPVCQRNFELKDIQFRSFANAGSAELSVICNRGHFPIILLVPINLKEANQAGPIGRRELGRARKSIDDIRDSFEELD